MKDIWERLVERFGIWVLLALLLLLGGGLAASLKEWLLVALLFEGMSAGASMIFGAVLFGVAWFCRGLRAEYESKGCYLADEDKPSLWWTLGPTLLWFLFVYCVFAKWDPSVHETRDSDERAELMSQFVAAPILMGLVIHAIATTVKHGHAFSAMKHREWLEEIKKRK